jgi:hypothetical protein
MDEQEYRRLRRDFVRRHHPDAGGDQHEFVVGLRKLELAMRDDRPAPRVEVVAPSSWPRRVWRAGVAVLTRRSRPPRVR